MLRSFHSVQAFVVGSAALLATRSRWAPAAFAAYAALSGVEAVRVGRRAGWWAVPVVWAIFPVLHVAHGVGMGYGLALYLRRPDWSEPERLAPR